MPPASRPSYHLDPAEARQHIARIKRFRILVMGRANAGKTTILQRVCNTTDKPEIYNGQGQKVDTSVVLGSRERGHHDIEDELVFASNRGFVFHDSCGFEAGSEKELERMKKFVMDRAKTTELDERIHAIWFCIPLTERQRMVTKAEEKFFHCCDTGHVPVIVLLTKADTLSLDAFQEVEELMEEGMSIDDAVQCTAKLQERLLNSSIQLVKERLNGERFPPQDYLALTGMHQKSADCKSLLTCTTNALNEERLQQLLISTQQSNLALCMEFAIMKGLKNCLREESKVGANALASIVAPWFPYKWGGRFEFGLVARAGLALGLAKEALVAKLADAGTGKGGFSVELGRLDGLRLGAFAGAAMDNLLVPDIWQPLIHLTMPALSPSMQPSMQYTAELGIGATLVLEYFYFLLQAKDGSKDWQRCLDLAAEEYQTSGTQASVCKLIEEAFHEHVANMDILCPVFVQIAKQNQMSKKLNRQG